MAPAGGMAPLGGRIGPWMAAGGTAPFPQHGSLATAPPLWPPNNAPKLNDAPLVQGVEQQGVAQQGDADGQQGLHQLRQPERGARLAASASEARRLRSITVPLRSGCR